MVLGDAWIVFGLFVFGLLGFFAVVLAGLARLVRAVLRGLGVTEPNRSTAAGRSETAAQRTCGHPQCGHVNPGSARYCGRCGRLLDDFEDDIDSYG